MTSRSTRTRRPELRQAAKAVGLEPQRPLRAIRAKCLDCCAGQRSEVANCTATTCPLWAFRFGVDPWRKPATAAQCAASVRNARRNLR